MMNNFFEKLSRRERLAVLIAVIVLFVAGVLYAFQASDKFRQAKLEELRAVQSLCTGYQTLMLSADPIRAENRELKEVLSQTDGLLFDRVGNDVLMEVSIIKLLNQLAPDLGLDVSMSKPSLRAVPGQLNFSVRGSGRYPEILSFLYKLETHRPLIVVDRFDISVRSGRGSRRGRSRVSQPSTASAEQSEPQIRLRMDIHINCRTAEEKGK